MYTHSYWRAEKHVCYTHQRKLETKAGLGYIQAGLFYQEQQPRTGLERTSQAALGRMVCWIWFAITTFFLIAYLPYKRHPQLSWTPCSPLNKHSF